MRHKKTSTKTIEVEVKSKTKLQNLHLLPVPLQPRSAKVPSSWREPQPYRRPVVSLTRPSCTLSLLSCHLIDHSSAANIPNSTRSGQRKFLQEQKWQGILGVFVVQWCSMMLLSSWKDKMKQNSSNSHAIDASCLSKNHVLRRSIPNTQQCFSKKLSIGSPNKPISSPLIVHRWIQPTTSSLLNLQWRSFRKGLWSTKHEPFSAMFDHFGW